MNPVEEPEEAEESEDPNAGKSHVLELAEKAGMLPQYSTPPSPAATPVLNPNYWKFAGAKALRRWDETTYVTQEEFDAAVEEVTTQVYR